MSDKTKAKRQALAPYRVWLRSTQGRCEACFNATIDHIHEIPAGSHRDRAIERPNTWLALCWVCHEELQGKPFEEQFAIKVESVRRDINWCVGRNVV